MIRKRLARRIIARAMSKSASRGSSSNRIQRRSSEKNSNPGRIAIPVEKILGQGGPASFDSVNRSPNRAINRNQGIARRRFQDGINAERRYRNWMLGREKDEKEGEGGASTAINRARIFTVAAAGRNARIWNFLDRPSSSNLEMLENCCSEAFPSPFELRR